LLQKFDSFFFVHFFDGLGWDGGGCIFEADRIQIDFICVVVHGLRPLLLIESVSIDILFLLFLCGTNFIFCSDFNVCS